jgi:hypothetical protein
MNAPPSGGGADYRQASQTTFRFFEFSRSAAALQAQPVERHDPLADDKLVLWPSPLRPLQRDLERLVARWEGWR